jgi:hypothetical protein
MTTKIYQAQLPFRNHRIITPYPMPRPPRPPQSPALSDTLAHNLQRSVEQALMFGFWSCGSCNCKCERVEGEQGQPAHSNCCQSPRLTWNPPIDHALKKEVV